MYELGVVYRNIKKAVLLYFRSHDNQVMPASGAVKRNAAGRCEAVLGVEEQSVIVPGLLP